MTGLGTDLDCIVTRNNDIIHTEIDDDVVVMDIAQNTYFGLTEVGQKVWSLIETPCSIADICDELMRLYNVEKAQCIEDIVELLDNMQANDLVQLKR